MALKTMIDKLNEAKKAYDEQLKNLGADLSKQVAEHLAPHIPPGYSIRWTQYTPYFNDGEPCTFGVYDLYLDRDDLSARENKSNEIDIGTAIRKYGQPDEEKSYQDTDYHTVVKRDSIGRPVEYGKKTVTYTNPGFPEIEGYSKEQMQTLRETFEGIPEDLMEAAFGDGVEVRVRRDGSFDNDSYDHD
jgi:hypothetical protein